ncbi:MAG: alpha/beta hydrolase, partial [Flavisolibacter sp.]
KNEQQDLTLDLYTPPSGKTPPLILFMHGGGFVGGDKAPISAFCVALADKGFVVANINYRVGFDTSASKRAIGIAMASYRAAQDQASALRFLVHQAKEYHIDTQYIFIGGESAGAVTSLENGFMAQSDWDSIVPLLHQQLGNLQNSDNDFKESYSIKGITSMWGGVVDTSLISTAESRAIPILLIQSQADEAIPFEHAKNKGVAYSSLYGSYDIAQRYTNAGSCAILLYTKNAKHYFGFSQHYVVQAMQQFVNDVMAGKCQSRTEENIGADNSLPFSRYQ